MVTLWLLMPLYQITEAKRLRTRRILSIYSTIIILLLLGPWLLILGSLLSLLSPAILVGGLIMIGKMHYIALACILAESLREWLDGSTDSTEERY